MDSLPYLYQINRSSGGLPKLPVPQVAVASEGIEGDRQKNRVYHGGPDRAVCLFSLERIQALQEEGHTVYPGATGENLTVAGLDWTHLKPGDHLNIGHEVSLELTSYCEPCRHTGRWFVAGNYQRISQEHHPGWSRFYARVLSPGRIRQGDQVWVEVTCDKERK